MGRTRSAFTLIELLVVIALTTILLTVLFAPLIQAFQFTEQAQATAEAQDAARQTTEELTRELSSAAAVRDTTGNYLDLPLLNKSGNQIIAHAYNAYIDIIPPRPQQPAKFIDPTIDRNNPTVDLNPPSGPSGVTLELGEPGVGLPLSAGSTVVRYFVGLRYPIDPLYTLGTTQYNDPQPYTNHYDGLTVSSTDSHFSSYAVKNGLNNTYQLYRANFQPYMLAPGGSTYQPNTDLFETKTVNGVSTPIYDDPDFFRIVSPGEPDLAADLSGGTVFTTMTAQQHNDRVYNWFKIAKAVISTKEIDLVGLPRRGKSIIFDSQGNPVDAYESNGTTPIVRTTINFAPGLVSNDPLSASNNSDISQGYGESPEESTDGLLPYVPTLFQSQYGNWQGTPAITITKTGTNYTGGFDYEQTRTYTATDAAVSPGYTLGTPDYSGSQGASPTVGDLILADIPANTPNATGTPVYDITQGAPIDKTAGNNPSVYDALLLDMNRGEVTFAIPALPLVAGTQSSGPANTYFTVPPAALTGDAFNADVPADSANVINLGDFNMLPGTPLSTPASETGTNTSYVPNAVLVVNSERVVGPDLAPGVLSTTPTTDLVQYTRVTGTPTSPDQYSVDYQNNTITFDPNAVPSSVQIAFSYQNNLNTQSGSTYSVDTLRASYYTAAIMRLNLGVRVYGASTGNSQYFSLNSQVGVGNAKAN